MKTFTVSNKVRTDGTSLVGYLNTSFDKLVKVFGKPNFDDISSDDKVKIEWDIEFSDNTVATIYDWKNYNKSNANVKKTVTDWHVGGNSQLAFDAVVKEIKKTFKKSKITVGEYDQTIFKVA